MTARTGMTSIIEELRGMIDAGTADYTVGTVSYWTDDQLQTRLDRRRVDYKNWKLDPWTSYTGGTTYYQDYPLPWMWIESGTVMQVVDSNGTEYGTALWSWDTARQMVVFGSSTNGSLVAVNAHTYDLNRTASDIWREKAGHYALAYDIATDNTKLTRSQLQKQCLEMAKHYQGQAGVMTATIYRSDDVTG